MNYKHKKDPSYEKIIKIYHPGQIDNKMFYVDKDSYLKTSNDKEDELLKNPKPFDDAKQFVKQINKELWEFFYNKYNGGPSVYFEIEGEVDSSTMLFPTKIDFYILPKRKQFANKDKLDNIKPYTAYITQHKTRDEVLKYLEEIIDDNKLIQQLDEMFGDNEKDNNANEVENTDKEENTNNNNNTQQQQRFRF